MGTRFISRIIPMKTFNYHTYNNADESVNLLQACYENPLFEEDGAVIGDTHTKIHGQPDGLRTKPYDLPAAQTSVHFKQSSPAKRKGLYILAAIIGVIVVIAIAAAVIVGQRDGASQTPSNTDPVQFFTRRVDGHLRIYKGPFSTYTPEYSDSSSVPFSIFVSSFTYQMTSIFASSSDFRSSFSRTEIVNISSGSVIVNFILHFHQDVEITRQSQLDITSLIQQGLGDSLFIVEFQSVILQPIDPALSVITTSRPGVCLPLSLTSCANYTTWSYTTFPNLLGHRRPSEVVEAERTFQDLFYSSCGRDFWCAVFNPKCHRNKALPPCRSYCRSVFGNCFYETNITDLLDCALLPDSDDPNICTPDPYKPGICLKNEEEMCQGYGSEKVSFPNFAGQRSPYQASEMVQLFASINHATRCYKHSMLFACSAMMPKCSMSGTVPTHVIPPCKSLCNAFKIRCEIFMDIFWVPWPPQLFCDSFPDVNDTNVCFGYKEAHEPPEINRCPAGEDRCDNTTCIPLSWKCDDYNDCQDGSDEMAIQTTLPLRQCAVCPEGMFRCSPKSTICVENSRRCDGVEDCPTSSDERECVQLGDGGRVGILTIYNPLKTKWEPVCANNWNEAATTTVCLQLHYESALSTAELTSDTTSFYNVTQPRTNSSQEYIQSILTSKEGVCPGGKVVSIICGIPVCGIRPAYIPPLLRIVGGDLADPDAWPWQVSFHGGADYKYFCGGTIIAERWILTAGHCVGGRHNPSQIRFKLGQPRRNTYSPYLQEVHPQRIYLHPEYNPGTVDNDIALIYLNETIRFNDHVRPICLPKTSERLPLGTRCLAIGWGKPDEIAMDYERQIKQVYLEVVDQAECKASILGAERKVPYRLNDHMFCAGGGLGHDACSGDSGGPLLCLKDFTKDSWYTAGIVSWGVGCAYPNVPGVYTNLPGYLDWIHNITALPYL